MSYYIAIYSFKQTDRDGKSILDNAGNPLPDIPVTHKIEADEMPLKSSLYALASPRTISGDIDIQEVSKEVYDRS